MRVYQGLFFILNLSVIHGGRKQNKKKLTKAQRAKQSLQALYQPKLNLVQGLPASKGFDILSLPYGSPWCQGRPTVWQVGHQKNERPDCLNTDGTWTMSNTTWLDLRDALNSLDFPNKNLDRHSCEHLDVNGDGLEDIVCLIGANKGKGVGYNELYLTRIDGSLRKVPHHGLQKFPTMSTRWMTALTGPYGPKQFLFIATTGKKRADGRTNNHRMFEHFSNRPPYFREVRGPWINGYFEVNAIYAADFDGDGLDDLFVLTKDGAVRIYRQLPTGFKLIKIRPNMAPNRATLLNWMGVRLADFNSDGREDLVVVGPKPGSNDLLSYLRIFPGMPSYPFWDFNNPIYQTYLGRTARDVEILDVNCDGRPDIYVVQEDRTVGNYCKTKKPNGFWGRGPQPPRQWLPPNDLGRDFLFVGIPSNGFLRVPMIFNRPGCGSVAAKFGDDQTLIVSQADSSHPGWTLELTWDKC